MLVNSFLLYALRAAKRPSPIIQKWTQYVRATTHIHICSWGKTSTRRPLLNSCHSWVHSCIVCNSWWLGNWYYFIHLICNIKVFSKINIICPKTENLSIARSKEEIYFSEKCKEKGFFGILTRQRLSIISRASRALFIAAT